MANGPCPVNLVITPVQVFDGEQYKVPVLLVERNERQDNVKICLSMLTLSSSRLWQMLIEYGLALRIRFIEHTQRTSLDRKSVV